MGAPEMHQQQWRCTALGIALVVVGAGGSQHASGETPRARSRTLVNTIPRTATGCPCRTNGTTPERRFTMPAPAALVWTEPWRRELHQWLGRLVGNQTHQPGTESNRSGNSRLTRLRVRQAAKEQTRLPRAGAVPLDSARTNIARDRGLDRNRLEQRSNRRSVLRWVPDPAVRRTSGTTVDRR